MVELFTTIGKVQQAQIQYGSRGGSPGTGVVDFATSDDAGVAISKFTNYQYGGRPLRLSYVKYMDAEKTSIWEMLADAPISGEELTKIDPIDAAPPESALRWVVLTWEVPQLLSKTSRMTDLSNYTVISGTSGIYEASTTPQHLMKHWHKVGADLLNAIQDALAHMGEVQR